MTKNRPPRSNEKITERLFFTDTPLGSEEEAKSSTTDALANADDGCLFMEYMCGEGFTFEDGRLKNTNFETRMGMALSASCGEATTLAHCGEFSPAALGKLSDTVKSAIGGYNGAAVPLPDEKAPRFYPNLNPLAKTPQAAKTDLLAEIDRHVRRRDERVCQVNSSMNGSWQAVRVIDKDGRVAFDVRPLVRLNVRVTVKRKERMETGVFGFGGRSGYDLLLAKKSWQKAADEALRQAVVNLDAIPTPGGETTVVLASGWPGILLHEAVGHGLEGDFIRKKTSTFSAMLGQRVAAKGVTVVDDGSLAKRRGSLSIDDEGTPGQPTTLIEDGVVRGFMQDRLNARLSNTARTGNGRRESYAHPVMPRMTNTYMLGGNYPPEELISAVKRGVYAVNFGGGQVDITSGKFVFSSSEAYLIENGKITAPLRNATLIGDGATALTRIKMLGNDMRLDEGIGTCGKEGQMVPVGVGQPSLLIERLTVGGTEAS